MRQMILGLWLGLMSHAIWANEADLRRTHIMQAVVFGQAGLLPDEAALANDVQALLTVAGEGVYTQAQQDLLATVAHGEWLLFVALMAETYMDDDFCAAFDAPCRQAFVVDDLPWYERLSAEERQSKEAIFGQKWQALGFEPVHAVP
ncbi:MAG: hypothetical protein KA214_02415 [Neisseriaceae bacterium]|nr:hypothetical protein [Neisseriaceae bacterium]